MSNYTHIGMALATTKQAGNVLASALAVEPGDYTAFNSATPVYAPGTTFADGMDGPLRIKVPSAPPAAWFIKVLMRTEKAAAAQAMIASGLPPGVTAQVVPRETADWRAFIESNGYVLP